MLSETMNAWHFLTLTSSQTSSCWRGLAQGLWDKMNKAENNLWPWWWSAQKEGWVITTSNLSWSGQVQCWTKAKADVSPTFTCPLTASGKLCLQLLTFILYEHNPFAGCKPQLPLFSYLQACFTRQRTLTDMLCRSHFSVWHSTRSVMGKFIDESCKQTHRHNLSKLLDTDCTELQSRKSCFFKLCYKAFLSIGTDSPKLNKQIWPKISQKLS